MGGGLVKGGLNINAPVYTSPPACTARPLLVPLLTRRPHTRWATVDKRGVYMDGGAGMSDTDNVSDFYGRNDNHGN